MYALGPFSWKRSNMYGTSESSNKRFCPLRNSRSVGGRTNCYGKNPRYSCLPTLHRSNFLDGLGAINVACVVMSIDMQLHSRSGKLQHWRGGGGGEVSLQRV